MWSEVTKFDKVQKIENDSKHRNFNNDKIKDRTQKILDERDIILESSAESHANRQIVEIEDELY